MKLVKVILVAAMFAFIWSDVTLPQTRLQGGDNIDNAFVIPYIGFRDSGTTVGYTDDYDGNCGIDNGAPDVVYSFSPTADHGVAVSFVIQGTDFSARLYVFRDTPDSIIACIDNPFGQINCLSLVDGYTYYFVIDGYNGASGNYSFRIEPLSLPPSIDGIVTESGGGPIDGTIIRALQDGIEIWRDTTSSDGYFSTYLWSGTYNIEASKPGFVTQTSDPLYCAPCEYHYLNFVLEPLPPPIGTIAGIATECDGVPIDSVLIRALQEGSEIARDTTGPDGLFLLPEMQLGLYDIEASKDLYMTQTQHDIEVFADRSTWVTFQMESQIHSACLYWLGDLNNSRTFTGLDVVYGVAFFKGGPPPPFSCECQPGHTWYTAGDVNGSCSFTGLDITYMVAFLKGEHDVLIPCCFCPPPPER